MTMALTETRTEAPIRAPASRLSIARIAIADDLATFEGVWRALERDGVASPYQSFDWVRLWHEKVSGPRGETPLIVVGFDAGGSPSFLWPLVRDRFGPFRIATHFGGKHATLNFFPWRRETAEGFRFEDMAYVFGQITERAPDLDFVMLFNQPNSWNGAPNPFALLPHHRSTEDNFVLHIGGRSGKEVLEQELSNSMRSRLRNKERKLARLPGYHYLKAATAADVDRCLDTFFVQKAEKLTMIGLDNVFGHDGVEDFIRAACHEGLATGNPVIELHALEIDGDMLALFSGIHDRRRFTSMFNSHTNSENSRQSPGLILLQHVVTDCAARGFESFDIGPGEARYKSFFCKTFEPIFDSILPLSSRARLAVLPVRAAFRLKSEIKHNPTLWSVASFVRRSVNRFRRGAVPADD
ncbi:MAG: GNAT family N-acetyltransferase [Pseudorhodoplanes sp.]|nr:GNAT family N-acetyltransferase [Pseudorhodoplanes sp.]